ncbi:MAG: ATP-binding protein [Gammaproteobacteria bacterium]|nr:ATP-binding protein [Gammaproteobacteria bacterium]
MIAARTLQVERRGSCNAELGGRPLERVCAAGADAGRMLAAAMERMALSARAYHRILRVARTIADLAGCEGIGAEHVAEAIQFRALDCT